MLQNKTNWLLCLCLCLNMLPLQAKTVVDIETNLGTITIQLYPDKAPITVANFLNYVDSGFYTNIIFHRIISGFVAQSGQSTTDLIPKTTNQAILLESNNGLKNNRGSIAMARTSVPDSATSQFYFNLVDNNFLDYQDASNVGYAVFGDIINGLEVMDKIGQSVSGTVTILSAKNNSTKLVFSSLKEQYQAGDQLTISLIESGTNRDKMTDLWVAIALADGQLLFLSKDLSAPLSTTPQAFQTALATDQIEHKVLDISLPDGLTGNYMIYAIYNTSGSDLSNLSQTIQSNLASANIIIN